LSLSYYFQRARSARFYIQCTDVFFNPFSFQNMRCHFYGKSIFDTRSSDIIDSWRFVP